MPQSTINPKLAQEIHQAVKAVGSYGSIEIYIQSNQVTQVTTRKIHKTKHSLNSKNYQTR